MFSNNIRSSNTYYIYSLTVQGENGGFEIFFSGRWDYAKWPENGYKPISSMTSYFLTVPSLCVCIDLARFLVEQIHRKHVPTPSTSKSKRVVAIVHNLVLITLNYNITVRAHHIPIKQNSNANCISLSQWKKYQQLA